MEPVIASPLSRHALFLRVLLQELRAVGRYAELSTQIAGYLEAASLSDLYAKAVRRWERDYGADVVRQSLALIAVCPNGISEHDLRMMLARRGEPLESAKWSPLLASAETDLSPRRGFLAVTNDYVSRALHDYLRPEDERTARDRVANLYRRVATTRVDIIFADGVETRHPGIRELAREGITPFTEMKERAFYELPAQLAWLERWDDLLHVLKSREYLDWAFENAGTELCRYWHQLSANRPGAALALCEGIDFSSAPGVRRGLEVAGLLEEIGEYGSSLSVRDNLDAVYRRERDWSSLGQSRLRRAAVLRKTGDFSAAFDADREAEALFQAGKNEVGCADALASQGTHLARLHDDRNAVPKLEFAMRVFQKEGLRERLAFVYDVLGLVLARRGASARGIEYLQRAETIFREIGDREDLARTLGNRAFVLASLGRLSDALKFRDEAARLRSETGGEQEREATESR
jgi:tetratricopeptide (TPR) repeat protein